MPEPEFPIFIDDLNTMIAKSKEIHLDWGTFDQEAMLKSARIRDGINDKARGMFYRANEMHLYFQMDASAMFRERILQPYADAMGG